VPATFEPKQSFKATLASQGAGDQSRLESVRRQWVGISGIESGTRGRLVRAFLYSLAVAAVLVAAIVASNVMTWMRDRPGSNLVFPIVAEGTSGLTFLLFFWIPWIAWLWAPPFVRPRWKLLVHIPSMLAFALCHIGGFVLLRRLAAWMPGIPDISGPFMPEFIYDARKDALFYLVFGVVFALAGRLLRLRASVAGPHRRATYDIRDGAKLTRVPISDILAVSSAGNYVEFVLGDGRRMLMRLSLSALEGELGPLGFVRTHRSWLVNAKRVTGLKPGGSGDYEVEVTTLTVPLSRRFPQALARLRDVRA